MLIQAISDRRSGAGEERRRLHEKLDGMAPPHPIGKKENISTNSIDFSR